MEQKKTQTNTENKGRIFTGKVVSDKMKDTVVVLVERYTKHPKYQKFMHSRKRYKAHDAGNVYKMGDKVRIIECRPISKDKTFKVLEKVAA